MASQTQGKGKKKNKEVMKVSLDEFNQIDAPHGHSVVNLKMTGLDWAETMADYDQQSVDTQQIIVPAAPRAQRGPNVDLDSLPDEGPFKVSLLNLPMAVEERDIIERFFSNLNVIRVEIGKASTTVELGSKNDLYDALCKDGSQCKGRTVNVYLYGHERQNTYGSDRYGGRSSGSSFGDRYGDRGQGGFGGSRLADRYGDRSSGGGYNRDRDNYSGGYNRNSGSAGGFGGGGPRGNYGLGDRYSDRYSDRGNFRESNRGQYTSGGGEPVSEEPTDWRARPSVKPPPAAPSSYDNGSKQPYMHSRNDQAHNQPMTSPQHQQYQPNSYQQSRYQHHNQNTNNSPYSPHGSQSGSFNRPSPPLVEERPKLVLEKRKTPLNPDDRIPETRNEAIFGKAKPTSTPYQKMNEIEEKLTGVQITEGKNVKTE